MCSVQPAQLYSSVLALAGHTHVAVHSNSAVTDPGVTTFLSLNVILSFPDRQAAVLASSVTPEIPVVPTTASQGFCWTHPSPLHKCLLAFRSFHKCTTFQTSGQEAVLVQATEYDR